MTTSRGYCIRLPQYTFVAKLFRKAVSDQVIRAIV